MGQAIVKEQSVDRQSEWEMMRIPNPEQADDNQMEITFAAVAENEQLARMVISAFTAPLNPTLEELSDVKTAVSEAVTNAIIHGYDATYQHPQVHMRCSRKDRQVQIWIWDCGVGIADLKLAMQPLYTSRPELERSGMGFAFMEAFMDELQVESQPGKGTRIYMKKYFSKGERAYG